jgi:hypothetical protein
MSFPIFKLATFKFAFRSKTALRSRLKISQKLNQNIFFQILEEYFQIKISACCSNQNEDANLPQDLALSLPNTWLGLIKFNFLKKKRIYFRSKEEIEFEKTSVVSILDFHFAVC